MIRCLFVEDDYVEPAGIQAACFSLSAFHGHMKWLTLYTGQKAFLKKESFDVVVTDFHLPDGNAFDILEMGWMSQSLL